MASVLPPMNSESRKTVDEKIRTEAMRELSEVRAENESLRELLAAIRDELVEHQRLVSNPVFVARTITLTLEK